jgi:hypothetical protein
MRHRNFTYVLVAIGVFCVIAAQAPKVFADRGKHGSLRIPSIKSSSIVRVVDPLNPDPSQRLYGTLDMMDLVKVSGEKIVVIAHEIFPPRVPGGPGQLDAIFPDAYDGLNRGLGLGAVSAWDLKTGEFRFLIPPKNTFELEPYDENMHTSGTDGVRATDWGTALIAEEWSQSDGRAGHILEVDPLTGQMSRVKAMGAFSHEGIAIQKVKGNYVFYQGDEQRGGGVHADGTRRRGGAIYRFIPNRKPRAFGELQANGGALQAFDFAARQWVTVPEAVVAANDANVIRHWADSNLSPVSLWERPEDIEYDPVGGNLYIAVTEKSCTFDPTTAQCAPGSELDGARNPAGHVVRLNPETGSWSIFVDADRVNAQLEIEDPVFGNPDNLVLDHEGRLYIAQDGGDPNDSIWIATPDKDGDGVADHFQRFLNLADAGLGVPADSGEPTGFLFLNEKTLLVNFQGGSRPADFGPNPISRIIRIELGGTDE